MKLRIIVLVLASITVFSSCRDISFNNPLDPNASKETAKLIKIINTPVSGIGDIDYDDGKVWKMTQYGSLYLLDIESGMIIREIKINGGNGIAQNNGKLYVCKKENSVKIFDSLSEELLKQLLTADIYPEFCAFVDDAFIVYDIRSNSIFSVNIENGDSIRLFELSGIGVAGICEYKGGVLIADDQTDVIYSYSINGKILNVYRSPASEISGIAVDNNDNIYIFNTDGRIYKVSLP